jgi:hypothetical protein
MQKKKEFLSQPLSREELAKTTAGGGIPEACPYVDTCPNRGPECGFYEL